MRAALLALAVGVALGGLAGHRSFRQVDDPRALCGTCHHAQTRLEERQDEAPHRTDLGDGCHRCHVLPVKEYLQALSAEVGTTAPAWVSSVTDPVLGGQTCLDCHVGRGRGAIDCDRCHADGDPKPRLDQDCPACHEERPLHPHDTQDCKSCHVETLLDHRDRTDALMRQKLHLPEDR